MKIIGATQLDIELQQLKWLFVLGGSINMTEIFELPLRAVHRLGSPSY